MMNRKERLILIVWAVLITALLTFMTTKALSHGDGCRVDNHTLRHITDPAVKAQFGLADAPHVHGFFDSHGSGYAVSGTGPLRPDCSFASSRRSATTEIDRTTEMVTSRTDTVIQCGIETACHTWDLNITHRVGVPVLPEGIETIADLWDHVLFETGKRVTLQTLIDGLWRTYDGETDETGATLITAHTGLIIWHVPPFVLEISGESVEGKVIDLNLPDGKAVALHAIGFPEPPTHYTRISDLVIEGVDWVQRRVRVDGELRYQYIRRAGDDGDKVIEAGDFVVMRIRRDLRFDFRGDSVAAAPSVNRSLTTSWAEMKGR